MHIWWKLLDYVINFVLIVIAVSLSQNLWVIIPVALIAIWNYFDGFIRWSMPASWMLLDLLVNFALFLITLIMSLNLWVVLPIILIEIWNYFDGQIRSSW